MYGMHPFLDVHFISLPTKCMYVIVNPIGLVFSVPMFLSALIVYCPACVLGWLFNIPETLTM